MNKENIIAFMLVGFAIVAGVFLGVSLAQSTSIEKRMLTSDIKALETSMNNIDSSIREIDSSLKELKTGAAEKEKGLLRRGMQENGRRMLSLEHAGKLAKWDAVKKEADELDKTLQDAVNLQPDLSSPIQDFRAAYIPKLKDAADKKNTTYFEKTWSETYDACIACHRNSSAPPEAFEALSEISTEIEQLR